MDKILPTTTVKDVLEDSDFAGYETFTIKDNDNGESIMYRRNEDSVKEFANRYVKIIEIWDGSERPIIKLK